MTRLTIISAILLASACSPNIKEKPAQALQSYQASEFEPSWSLTLSNGTDIAFRQLDPDSGADFITDQFTVTEQVTREDGWRIRAVGPKGTLTFTTTDVSPNGGCTHSGSGYSYRDTVTLVSPLNTWRGCGGPEI